MGVAFCRGSKYLDEQSLEDLRETFGIFYYAKLSTDPKGLGSNILRLHYVFR